MFQGVSEKVLMIASRKTSKVGVGIFAEIKKIGQQIAQLHRQRTK
jgi:hypothetical protein